MEQRNRKDADGTILASYQALSGFPFQAIPFFVAVSTFVLARVAGVPIIAAPIIAGAVSLSAACLACVGTRDEKAVITVASGIANVGIAFFVFPWLVNELQTAMAAWVAASDLLVVALFGTDHLIAIRDLGRPARTVASGVSFQAGLLACMYIWPHPLVIAGLSMLYLVYTVVVQLYLRQQFAPVVGKERGASS